MKGLLYKDFIAVKGKRMLILLSAVALLFLGMRFIPDKEMADLMSMGLYFLLLMILVAGVLFFLEIQIITVDNGRREREFVFSLPVSKKAYVASKYIFLFFVCYGIVLFSALIGLFSLVGMETQETVKNMGTLIALLPAMGAGMLLLIGLELPFYFGFGLDKGKQIKTGIVLVLFFCFMMYMLFGDLTILDKINLVSALEYFQKHHEIGMGLNGFLPLIAILFYYGSYLLSCKLFVEKE